MSPETKKKLEEIKKINTPWCGDNSCCFGVPPGPRMATNGGCRCFNRQPITPELRDIIALVKVVPDLLHIIKSDSKQLEAVTNVRKLLMSELNDMTDRAMEAENLLEEATKIMEGVLVQAGYTCMGAYEAVEGFLGVEWSTENQRFEYPNGDPIE